jgi:hypothetical protein
MKGRERYSDTKKREKQKPSAMDGAGRQMTCMTVPAILGSSVATSSDASDCIFVAQRKFMACQKKML